MTTWTRVDFLETVIEMRQLAMADEGPRDVHFDAKVWECIDLPATSPRDPNIELVDFIAATIVLPQRKRGLDAAFLFDWTILNLEALESLSPKEQAEDKLHEELQQHEKDIDDLCSKLVQIATATDDEPEEKTFVAEMQGLVRRIRDHKSAIKSLEAELAVPRPDVRCTKLLEIVRKHGVGSEASTQAINALFPEFSS